jgi:uncharacterized protein YjdB/cell division septation protein DedD
VKGDYQMKLKRLHKMIISLLVVCAMILSPMHVSAENESVETTPVKDITVTNSHYFGSFTITKDSLKQIEVSVAPKNATNKTLKWETSNPEVVQVDEKGMIKGLKEGNTDITVSATDGSKVKEVISIVVGRSVKKISTNVKRLTLKPGDSANIKTTVSPKDATNKTVNYLSTDSKVASVSSKGHITAVAEGKATISISAKDGSGKRALVFVTVYEMLPSQTLTAKDVVAGKINLSEKRLRNLTIDSSVGDAQITLDNVTVKGNLEMSSDASYTVHAKNSNINKVVTLEEKGDEITSFAINQAEEVRETPTFVAEKGTLVISIDARGNVSVKQEDTALIGTVTVNRKADGNFELQLEGFSGNLVVNTESNADIAISTKACNIGEATIGGTSSGQKLSITDDTSTGKQSSINKINVETSAKLMVDIPAGELVIGKTVENADVSIEKPITKIQNEGKATELTVNSNVTNIVSSGEGLDMTVAAGSAVSDVVATGKSTKIEVGLGSSIGNIMSKGDASQIGGAGKIAEVKVEGNDTKINNSSAIVSVGSNVTGTVSNGTPVAGGTVGTIPVQPPVVAPTQAPTKAPTQAPTKAPTQAPTPTGNPEDPPVTGTLITINNPGKVWAGTDVTMTADLKNIKWSVYNDVNDSGGYADIEPSTGDLSPWSTGVVRVVATSMLNPEVYGAVDVTIYGKKFVGYKPLNPVIIDQDQSLCSIKALSEAGKLPTTVDMIYETGNGTETEVITVNIDSNSWYGYYDYDLQGINILRAYNVDLPLGYERPRDLNITVYVMMNVLQTGIQKDVVGHENSIGTIVLSKDENIVKMDDLYRKYFSDKEIVLLCKDGTKINGALGGWQTDSGNQFNGAVPGTYTVILAVDLPAGYRRKEINAYATNVYWFYYTSMDYPVNIVVETAQTQNDVEHNMPITTQAKFAFDPVVVQIESVNLIGVPSEVKVGEVVDLNAYLSVVTNTLLVSDRRVTWSVNGYNALEVDTTSGRGVFTYPNTYLVTATSVVDRTKKATVSIRAVNSKSICSLGELAPIDVTQDLKVNNFRSMFDALSEQLPNKITGVDDQGQPLQLTINGWYLQNNNSNYMLIGPYIKSPKGYSNNSTDTNLKIIFKVPQTDSRINVMEGTVATPILTLTEDKYATNKARLFDAMFGDSSKSTITVNAKLENNIVIPLQCSISGWNLVDENHHYIQYNGYQGNLIFELQLDYPEGYKNPNASNPDIRVEVTVKVTADQTPRYEAVWVTQVPKLTYAVGETLDLTNLLVRVRNTDQSDTSSDTYIGYDKFSQYGLQLRLGYEYGDVITKDTQLDETMDGEYIYVFNPDNNNYSYFGPLNIKNVISAFVPMPPINAGYVNELLYQSAEEVKSILPHYVHVDTSLEIPVFNWLDTDGYKNEAGSYTFTAVLGDLPDGYRLGENVAATIEVIVLSDTNHDITILSNFSRETYNVIGVEPSTRNFSIDYINYFSAKNKLRSTIEAYKYIEVKLMLHDLVPADTTAPSIGVFVADAANLHRVEVGQITVASGSAITVRMPVSDIVWGDDGNSQAIINFGIYFHNLAAGSDVSYTIESIKFLKNEVAEPVSTTQDSKLSAGLPGSMLQMAGSLWKYHWLL